MSAKPPLEFLISTGECCDVCNTYVDPGEYFFRWNSCVPRLALCLDCQRQASTWPVIEKMPDAPSARQDGQEGGSEGRTA